MLALLPETPLEWWKAHGAHDLFQRPENGKFYAVGTIGGSDCVDLDSKVYRESGAQHKPHGRSRTISKFAYYFVLVSVQFLTNQRWVVSAAFSRRKIERFF